MEDELRLSLLIVGTIIIIAVLAHGIWKIRKNSGTPSRRQRVEPGQWDETQYRDNSWQDHPRSDDTGQDFDELGIGKVRVVGEESNADETATPADNSAATARPSASADEAVSEHKLYGSVVSNPKPHMQRSAAESSDERPAEEELSEPVPEPPGFLLKDNPEPESAEHPVSGAPQSHGEPVSGAREQYQPDRFTAHGQADPSESENSYTAEPSPQAGHGTPSTENSATESQTSAEAQRSWGEDASSAPGERREPGFSADPAVDSDAGQTRRAQTPERVSAKEPKADAGAQEVLVLNVRAKDEQPITGAALLPMLLTLGFKFGDQDIFHRHINADGNGPVLFSLANMFKPGVFDIDNLETFTTVGVSLFMILPVEGDSHQVFNMMHNAARKIADEFDGQILDGRRSVLTKQGLQQYFEKIRDFERRRMLSRA